MKYKLKELDMVNNCGEKWIYKNLERIEYMTVLLYFPKYSYDVSSHPNLFIGVTDNKDTIAFLDKDFQGVITKGDKIELLPEKWTVVDKETLLPSFRMTPNKKDNDLYCKVKVAYYGQCLKQGSANR